MGFTNVYNKLEDFYSKLAGNNLPPHDVLLTNPPYSKDHVSRILRHAASSAVPALLLVPAYVHTEPYYKQAVRPKQCRNPPVFSRQAWPLL